MFEWFVPERKTWLYQVNPAFKFLLLFALMLVLFFTRQFAFVLLITCCYGGLLLVAGGYRMGKLLLLLLPFFLSFVSSSLTLILFGRGETVIWQWGLVKISEESIVSGLTLGMKSLAIGTISLVLLLTTRPVLLFYDLMQQFRFPAKYAYSFLAALRMVPALFEELQTRSHALKARGAKFSRGGKGVYQRLKLYSVPLLAQGIRKAHRIATAMEAKQFRTDRKRTYYYITTYTRMDVYMALFYAVSLTVAILMSPNG